MSLPRRLTRAFCHVVVGVTVITGAGPHADAAATWYVSSTGSPNGNGSASKPWDLQTALNQPRAVKPGDTIYLRAGTYIGRFISSLQGAPDSPIVVRPYPGELVRVDGNYATTLTGAVAKAPAWDYKGTIAVADSRMMTVDAEIRIDNELLQILAIDGRTIRVRRGSSGSCPTGTCPAHDAASAVNLSRSAVFTVMGSNAWYVGLEITDSSPHRVSQQSGSIPFDIDRGEGVTVVGPDVKIINFVIHDNADGIGSWSTAVNSELYGNVIFNNGWEAPDRKHGHGVYIQNETGMKNTRDNIAFHHFAATLHAYATRGSLKNLHFEGNMLFNGDLLIGGGVPLQNISLKSNYTYGSPIQFGFSEVQNAGLTLTDNYFTGLTDLRYWVSVTATGNSMLNRVGCPLQFIPLTPPLDTTTFRFERNTYHWSTADFGELKFCRVDSTNPHPIGFKTEWQAADNQDLDGSVVEEPTAGSRLAPAGKHIVLRPNAYDPNRAHLFIYNWDKADTVFVDIKSLDWAGGTKYRLQSVLDYFSDSIGGTYDGSGQIAVDMTTHTVAPPIGTATPLGPNTFPEFGAFVVTKVVTPIGGPAQDRSAKRAEPEWLSRSK